MKWSNRWLGVLPALALALGACERAAPTAAGLTPRTAAPPVVSASLTLTGHTGIYEFTVCSVGADASYDWTSTAWSTTNYSGAASSGSATVPDGGSTGDAAWASGKCQVVYTYPAIQEHAAAAPQVTATYQAQAGIQLDSIVRDSLTDLNLTKLCGNVPCNTGPRQTYASFTGTSTVAGAVNNDAGEIVFFYFTRQPSLSLAKTADAATVTAGSAIGFTLTASNGGPGVAKAVTLTDVLPTGTGISWSVSPANAACSISSGTLSCSFGDLAAGASASVHVTSPTTTQSCTVYNNTASAQATGTSAVTANASTTVECPPSLRLLKTADAASVSAGSPIGFTLTASNGGPGVAKNVTLSDPLPTGTGISWSISPANAACSITAGALSCSFGDLAAGASASVHVTSPTTTQSCAAYPNTATAQAAGALPVQASASTSVLCPNLGLVKTADAASVNAGSSIGFTMTVSNTGQGAAGNVTLSDPLPTGTGISWTINPANGACSISAGTLSCSFGTLAAGASASVHVSSPTTTGSCGTYNNTATAQATGVTALQASASEQVLCNTACGTFTIGYWKNHAGFGPQADVVTPLLPVWLGTAGGTKSVKVTTASQAVTLLQMNGKPSNPVNKLYAQLLAAKLSIATGVDGSAVASVIAQADAFLATHDDSSSLTKSEASTVNGWASTLDNYNNGIIGPGHCQ